MQRSAARGGANASVWIVAAAILILGSYAMFWPSKPDLTTASKPSAASEEYAAARAAREREFALLSSAQEIVRRNLKDPESANFERLFVSEAGAICGEVNSKNSFGGYTGYRRFIAYGGGLVFIASEMPPAEFEQSWSRLCK